MFNSRGVSRISLFFFSDDILIFSKAKNSEVRLINAVVSNFYKTWLWGVVKCNNDCFLKCFSLRNVSE
jgi:hypothetical protein